MPVMTIRPYEPKDEEGYYGVRSLVYHDGLPIPPDRRTGRFSQRYVGESGGQIAGVFNVLDMSSTRGEALLKCGGIAGVGVAPHHRRGGIGLEMMKWIVRELRATGSPLSSLYAFREPFYGKCGYVTVGKRLKLSVPVQRLPAVDTDLPIRLLTPNDWRELHPCYERFAHQRSGVHVRSEVMWERVLNERKALAIYAAGDPVEGYAAVSHSVEFWVEQWISEVAWSTPRGYRAALSILKLLGSNKTSVGWYEASDSPFYAHYLDQGVEVEVDRPVMFRICDVPAALAALKPVGHGELTLAVEDAVVPENNGPWKVRWSDGGASVEPWDGATDVSMDISLLTQAFMGEPSILDLARNGDLEFRTKEGLERAAQLLPPLPVFCGDFF